MKKIKYIIFALILGLITGCTNSSVSSTGKPFELTNREQFIASMSFEEFFGVALPNDTVGTLSLVTVSDGEVLQESIMVKEGNLGEVWVGFARNKEAYESNNLYTYDVTVAIYEQEEKLNAKWTIDANGFWLDDKSAVSGSVSSFLYQPNTINSNEKYQILGALYAQNIMRDIDEAQVFDCSGITDIKDLYQNISGDVDIAYLIIYEASSNH